MGKVPLTRHSKSDLTREEYAEAVEAYIEEYKESGGNAADVLHFQIMLRKIGMDEGEIDYLVRTT